ncbi:hypothetical protein LDENG_00068200 [Lucifuga dentata]|nr:hypothetical protein LDENG_00068200 [Lucifuga dentata]
MKKGALNFLGRKRQSLFDTNVEMKDIDNVELFLESSAIPESGTASVRARPTVKHHTSSSDSFQGFAVPTPKVPVLPTFNGPNTSGAVSVDRLSNGSVISVPDLMEGEIFVPPPPSMAPPPPPPYYVPPPPDFMGDLDDMVSLQPPSIPAPKLTSLPPEEDLTFLKPPPMAPPKPPSTCSSASTSSLPISSPPPAQIPEHPRFAPPQPPKTQKTPPPKPIRLSSIPNLDSPPQTPAPPPPVQTPTLSTFNPQNPAKLYNVPKTSILLGNAENETRPKQILLLEDSGSGNSTPVPAQNDGKAPTVLPPSKPVHRNNSEDLQEPKENLQAKPSKSLLPELNREAETGVISAQQEINKPLQNSQQILPQLQNEYNSQVNSEANQSKLEGSPSQRGKFSPLLDHKLRSLKSGETNGARDGPAASPLALLMAAKQRDKRRSSVSRENSTTKQEQSSTSIHQSDSNPNSFVVTPRSTTSTSLIAQDILQESPKSVSPVDQTHMTQTPGHVRSPTLVRDKMLPTSPSNSGITATSTASNVAVQKHDIKPTKSQSAGEELSMPLLPPPPEFANGDDFDEIMEPPPNIPLPDPPKKKAISPTLSSPDRGLPPTPKPKPQAPPKLHLLDTDVKPKPVIQTKPKPPPAQLPSPLSPSQATLLSILQKKMLEMDHKIAPMKETESSSDDWGTPLSDEDSKIPVAPRTTPKNNNYSVVNKTPSLDMRELENKVAKKYQETSSAKVPASNGPQSKHQYGMTFKVRPGTKQPITLVSKGDSL